MNLTADQITVDGDTAYVVAEGEYERCNGFPDSLRPPIVPPAWMTATCGPLWRPIHTFDVECPACDGTGHFGGRGSYYDRPGGKPCRSCKRGTISYRLAVREVITIYLDTDERAFRPDQRCVIIGTQGNDAGWVAVWSGDGDFTPLTLPPAAKLGDHLAICDVVS
jgi:hypothetical protein